MLCSKNWLIKSYYEYISQSVYDVNVYRQKNKVRWEIKDVMQLLYDIVAAGAYLQMNGVSHGLIKPEYIATDQLGHYILCDHLIDAGNFDVNLMDYKLNNNHYQDPMLWSNICTNRNNVYDPFKNDVFSFGMILLECCLIDNDEDSSNVTVENLRTKTHNRRGNVDFYYIFAA